MSAENKKLYKFDDVPLDDPRVMRLVSTGKTVGIFQMESQLMQDWAKKLRPQNLMDFAHLVAIVRPGCLEAGMASNLVEIRHGLKEPTYVNEALRPLLKDTYASLVYQETVLEIVKKLAGLTESEADTLRKALSKKKPEMIAACRVQFLEGCIKVGILSEAEAAQIFDYIEKGQRYLFNKCLDPSTMVDTPTGPRKIADLVIGDFVLAPTTDFTSNQFVEVLDVIDQGQQDLFEIELEDGTTIRSTLNHKFLCEDGSIKELCLIIEDGLRIGVI